MSDPLEPSKPNRIIIPGAEPEKPSDARIVLPPGVAREEPDDVPEYPRLRPLMLVPFSDGKRELLLVNDPMGIVPGQPVLGVESLALLQLMDGSVSVSDITSALMRENKDIRVAHMVRDFVAQLDKMLMLESPRFEQTYREITSAYHQLEVRQAMLEGHSYPADRDQATTFLEQHVDEARTWTDGASEAGATGTTPRALLAPHLDPRRAGAAIARTYLELAGPQTPLRVVVFGVGHALMGDLLALTRKHFETPLGRVECDTAFVDAVAAAVGETAYRSELTHRDEHSIEFQALYLRHLFGDRKIKIVPILVGGFHALMEDGKTPRDDATFESLITAVREAEAKLGGDTVYVAAVDFSHVGPRFGDPPLDERSRQEIEAKDQAAIEAARQGDAEAWYRAIASHQDSTRICGFGATYAMLRCAGVTDGRLLRYQQSDEEDGSMVSVASMAWG